MMKERPILFSAPMVRALLDGSKTQARRVVKPQPEWDGNWFQWNAPRGACAGNSINTKQLMHSSCRYGQPGDRLWVRETFARIDGQTRPWIETDYRATYKHGDRLGDTMGIKKRWTPSIHMPRHASRITLEITGVRVERLKDISHEDAIAEGVGHVDGSPLRNQQLTVPQHIYAHLWESINGPGSWEANPWVWVIEFKRLEQP